MLLNIKSNYRQNFRIRNYHRNIWRLVVWSTITFIFFSLYFHGLLFNVNNDVVQPLKPQRLSLKSPRSVSRRPSCLDSNDGNDPSPRSLSSNKLSSRNLLIRKLLQFEDNDSNVDEMPVQKDPKFPRDLFTERQLRNGAIIFHIIGMIYMFVALALVCDEFFIPSLDVITEKLAISEDVAGATFMAAGGSAPELFTSIIGVFISFDDVGIGTIVGSAVFNILFVLSMCAIFSKNVLDLTWWPLFRDVTFYSLILITLVLFFIDSTIYWYEALILLLWYATYVLFMKYNETIELFVKRLLNGAKVVDDINNNIVVDNIDNKKINIINDHNNDHNNNYNDVDDNVRPPNYQYKRKSSTPVLHGGGSKFRQGLLQLMIHSIDPLYEEPLQMVKRRSSSNFNDTNGDNTTIRTVKKSHIHPPGVVAQCPICGDDRKHEIKLDSNGIFHTHDHYSMNNNNNNYSNNLNSNHRFHDGITDNIDDDNNKIMNHSMKNGSTLTHQDTLVNENSNEPLDVSWPSTFRERLTYCLVAPIIIPLWLTLPDVRRSDKRKWFAITFIGSIIWIGLYSYFMVWWATTVGDTFRIPSEIMGLTFLAAGTSIPDLITSVLVARKGFGDMAVSSSIGSNIFDVAVGLPFPWLLYTMMFGEVNVNSSGMICSVILLFIMLLFVIITIALFKWRLNIGMAAIMFLLYFFFIACSLMLENQIIKCSSIVNVFSF